ncbi:MAG: ankyrin repeat domain-containing protein [Bacteroidales bacterium]|nr:ankyrin repeat domain-containing protein [Bacteroidales bacterium]
MANERNHTAGGRPMGMKIIKTRTTAVLFGLIFVLLSCKNEQAANTETLEKQYFPNNDVVEENDCETEEILGKYRDFCDCGEPQEIVLYKDGRFEYISYSENTDCHTHLEWKKEKNFIITSDSVNFDAQKIKIIKDFPVDKRYSVTIGYGNQKDEIEKSMNFFAQETVIVTEGIFSNNKAETYFFKEYDISHFNNLKCAVNKNRFIKRMIYSRKFFYKENEVLNTLAKISENNVDFNAKDDDGLTALHAAVDCGFEKTVELLLKNGADPKIKNTQGYTPLSLAKKNGSKEIVELLKKYGAKE